MNGILNSAWNWLTRNIERRAVESTRKELLALDDRTLADIGVSRVLLDAGAGAWPWGLEDHGCVRVDLVETESIDRDAVTVPGAANDAEHQLDRAA